MATCCCNGFETLDRRRPFFKMVLRRAALNGYKSGEVSADDTNKALDAIHNPRRKDVNGNSINIMELMHAKVVEMVQADTALSDDIKAAAALPEFDWNTIWDWIKENWMTILKVLLSLLLMFI